MKVACIVGLVVIALLLSACSGELYVGERRIDEYQATQKMNPQPLKCLFVSCTEAKGS